MEFGAKNYFLTKWHLWELRDNFSCIIVYADSTCTSMCQSNPTTAFDELIQYFTYTINVDILNICMKEFGAKKDSFTKWQLLEIRQFFQYKLWYNRPFRCEYFLCIWSYQMFQIANLKIICTDSTEVSFSNLSSAGLNCHLPKLSFFHWPLLCRGWLALPSDFFFFKGLLWKSEYL